jgi:hypothetical protein
VLIGRLWQISGRRPPTTKKIKKFLLIAFFLTAGAQAPRRNPKRLPSYELSKPGRRSLGLAARLAKLKRRAGSVVCYRRRVALASSCLTPSPQFANLPTG